MDDEGKVFTDNQTLLLLLDLVVSRVRHAKVALPVSTPMAAEHICAEAGAEIMWTKLSATHLMEALHEMGGGELGPHDLGPRLGADVLGRHRRRHRERHLGVPDPGHHQVQEQQEGLVVGEDLPSSSTRVRFSPPGSITAPRCAPDARTRSATCAAARPGSLAMTAAVAA